MALLARVLSNLSYCDIGEIGMVGSTFTLPPVQPPEAGAFSLTPVLPDGELGDPSSFEDVHSSPACAQNPCSTCKSCQDLWSDPYLLRAEALWVNPRKAYPPLV